MCWSQCNPSNYCDKGPRMPDRDIYITGGRLSQILSMSQSRGTESLYLPLWAHVTIPESSIISSCRPKVTKLSFRLPRGVKNAVHVPSIFQEKINSG